MKRYAFTIFLASALGIAGLPPAAGAGTWHDSAMRTMSLQYILSTALAGTWYVDASQDTGFHNGASWSDSFKYLQDAIQAAVNEGNPNNDDLIKVAAGTYYVGETRANPTHSDQTKSFILGPRMDIRGGLNGISELPNNGDGLSSSPTILTGDIDDHAGILDSGNSHIVVRAGTGSIPVTELASLERLTIEGGFNDAVSGVGGGILVPSGSSPTFLNCTIRNNFVADDSYGGGVFVFGDNTTETQFTGCTIEENKGGQGAGVAVLGGKALFEDCVIQLNEMTSESFSETNQGAGFLLVSADATFLRCQVLNNFWNKDPSSIIFAEGAGGATRGDSTLLMRDCVVAGNELLGGLFCACSGGGLAVANAMLVNCVIDSNLIDGKFGSYGAGVLVGGDARIINCVVRDNRADDPDDGHLHGGGIAFLANREESEVTNVLLHGNYADGYGGGLYVQAGSDPLPIVNATIAGNNHARLTAGGVYLESGASSSTTFTNCILYGNTDGAVNDVWQEQVTSVSFIPPEMITYSCVEDETNSPFGGAGNHNIDDDPNFVGTGPAPFKLSGVSACINNADSAAVPLDIGDLDDDTVTTRAGLKNLVEEITGRIEDFVCLSCHMLYTSS